MISVRCNVIRLFFLTVLVIIWDKFGTIGTRHAVVASPYSPENWICKDETVCVQVEETEELKEEDEVMSSETCNMMCPEEPLLWPEPQFIEVENKSYTAFQKQHIFLRIFSPTKKTKRMLERAANMFINNLTGPSRSNRIVDEEDEQVVKLYLHVKKPDTKLTSSTNESYILMTGYQEETVWIKIFAPTYYGVRHGLETLHQLIWYDAPSDKLMIIHDVRVIDEPSFVHRGIMIDVARNFVSPWFLKRVIDGMAMNKLNVLHIHASDSESFPLVLPNNPAFSENGAYNSEMTYSEDDMKDLINYANIRGVRIILEVDAPGHVTPSAWPVGQTICHKNDIFKSTLNPDDPRVFETLQNVYKDLLGLGSDDDTFHIGNDEVRLDCLRHTKAARSVRDPHLIWANFTNQMVEELKAANGGNLPTDVVLWSSQLTDRYVGYLKNKQNLVIQFWLGRYDHLFHHNYRIIFSTVGFWYLDCGFGPWRKNQNVGTCNPYTHWMKVYRYRPWEKFEDKSDLVLGGEVCLFTEQVVAEDVESRIWPRAAAFAERIWSDPEWEENDRDEFYRRFSRHITRMKNRGVIVAAIWPMYCSFYPEMC